MARSLVQYGSQGTNVEDLQKLLNKKYAKPKGLSELEPDGKFGGKTKDMVELYQSDSNLDMDGKVGKCTWSALEDTEKYNRYEFSDWVRQPNESECWAAAMAMLKGQGVPNRKRFQSLSPPVKFAPDGGIDNSHDNIRLYARYHHVKFAKFVKCDALCQMVTAVGRVMINVRGMHGSMAQASINDSHLMCIMGLRGSGEPGGTTLTIYNPWGRGDTRSKVTRSFQYLANRYPNLTYHCLYR